MSRVTIVLILVGLLAGAILVGNQLIPYSLGHFKKIEAAKLPSIIGVWRNTGGNLERLSESESSNASARVFQFRTNFFIERTPYSAILALEAGNFRHKGILIGTTNREVFWLDPQGRIERVFSTEHDDRR